MVLGKQSLQITKWPTHLTIQMYFRYTVKTRVFWHTKFMVTLLLSKLLLAVILETIMEQTCECNYGMAAVREPHLHIQLNIYPRRGFK
jgi:hypothetical protein